jgi:hypothetical protein
VASPFDSQVGGLDQPVAIMDLEIFHNLSTETLNILSNGEFDQTIFNNLMQLALSKSYLLYSLLALSALHLFSENRSRMELFARASFLHDAALRLVQPHITNFTEDDSIAVMVFSGMAATIELGQFVLNPNQTVESPSPIDKILDCFQMSKGVRIVMTPHWRHLHGSWIQPFLRVEDNREEILPILDKEFPSLSIIRCLVLSQDKKEQREACLYAVERVFLYICLIKFSLKSHPTCVKLIDAWPVEVDNAYEMMVLQRKPVALVILAHYAVLLSLKENAWWLPGLPRKLLEQIDGILGEPWAQLLSWPKEMIHGSHRPLSNEPQPNQQQLS